MSFMATFVGENLARQGARYDDSYIRLLTHVYGRAPPFAQANFGVRYRELASDAEWFAQSLIANSALEGYGSQQIWKFANRLSDPAHRAAVRQHSLDESRHSTMFVRMLCLTFPGLHIPAEDRLRIEERQPRFTRSHHPPIERPAAHGGVSDEEALTELMKVHITEIRALVLQLLLRPVLLAYAPDANRRVLRSASDVLIRDETRHIAYSATFFSQAAERGLADFIFDTFEREARAFDDLTLEELEREQIEI